MPGSALGLVAFFTTASLVAGVASTWVVGPRRPRAAVAPAITAFVVLYLVGHRSEWSFGPTVRLFGFHVALAFDVAVTVAAAAFAAVAQRVLLEIARRERQPGSGT